MSEPSSSKLPSQLNELLTFLHERQEKRGNCTMKDRAELWLRYGGEQMDISPPNFHHALATWLANAGLVPKDKATDVAAVLYCLGVTNSNNLFQKVNQGKLIALGIGKNGRRNAKGQRKG
jgi:integrase